MPPFEDFVADYQRLSPEPERFDELFAMLGDLWKVATDFTDEELESITVPVLILDGAQEEFVKPEDTKQMAALIPGAELVIMPDTGHFAPFARPEEFNRIVWPSWQARSLPRRPPYAATTVPNDGLRITPAHHLARLRPQRRQASAQP